MRATAEHSAAGREACQRLLPCSGRGGLLALALLPWLAGCASLHHTPVPVDAPAARRAGTCDGGFVASQDQDLMGRERTRALGPLYEHRSGDDGSGFLAFRPFYSDSEDPSNHVSRQDWLWPIGVSKQLHDEADWRFLLAYGNNFDRTAAADRYRFVIFPVLFMGRDKDGNGYGAIFPLGGTLHEYLGQDRIFFALFPLYAHSNLGEVETHSVLWPIVSWTDGGDVSKFRVFPFYGHSTKGKEQESRFILWPIWTSQSFAYERTQGSGYMLFPLWAHARSTKQETWMLIPPFFRWSRADDGSSGCCPWPFVRWSSGATDQLYLWPLWGRKQEGPVRESFWAWPIVRTYHAARHDGDFSSFRVLPFVNWEKRVAPAPAQGASAGGSTNVTARYLQLWPLLSYQREGDAARLRLLDLWPVKDTPGIERNWAPFWTLYTRASVGGSTEQELLWGLFRRRATEQGERRWSLFPLYSSSSTGGSAPVVRRSFLLGLVGYEKDEMRTAWRLLYWLRVGGKKDGTAAREHGGGRTSADGGTQTP